MTTPLNDYPDAVDEGALHRGREAAGAPPGGRRQVPHPQEVPAAEDHLGRRGDLLLLQGEVQTGELEGERWQTPRGSQVLPLELQRVPPLGQREN